MSEDSRYEALNTAIDEVILRGEAASTGDEELDALARVASGLRGLPRPGFKAALSTDLMPSPSTGGSWTAGLLGFVPGSAWLKGQLVFLAGGSSFGLVAGTCCLSGAAAYASGLSGAAAVNSFIHSTIPYFIALSIVSMVAWLAWLLRGQGVTLAGFAGVLRRHGMALAGSYAAVFAATMSVPMLMGLY
jgi:hypothetical protein